ncbi:hypothetical protein ABBQ32_013735 [Trebouxia sp. C0010 RCD-2024]
MDAGPGPGSAASRADGRNNLQIRTLLCERGLLHRADGSARWCQDKTCVVAAIYGPKMTLGRKEDPEQAVVEVVFKPKSGVYRYNAPGQTENLIQKIIRNAVQGVFVASLHPRTAIQVVIQVVRDEGSVLSCALNATCAALVDAGVLLHNMFAAVSCAIGKQTGALLLDPDASEEKDALAVGSFAFCASGELIDNGRRLETSEAILVSSIHGSMDIQQYLTMLELARQGCQRIAEFTRLSLDKVFS